MASNYFHKKLQTRKCEMKQLLFVLTFLAFTPTVHAALNAKEVASATVGVLYLHTVPYTHPLLKTSFFQCIGNVDKELNRKYDENEQQAQASTRKSERDQQLAQVKQEKSNSPMLARLVCSTRWVVLLNYYGLPGLNTNPPATKESIMAFMADMSDVFFKEVSVALSATDTAEFINKKGPWIKASKALDREVKVIESQPGSGGSGAFANQLSIQMATAFDNNLDKVNAFYTYPMFAISPNPDQAFKAWREGFEAKADRKLTDDEMTKIYNASKELASKMGCRAKKSESQSLVEVCSR